jgi:hypothetical protein
MSSLLILLLSVACGLGRAIAQAISRRLPTAARVRSQVRSCGILVDKMALGQVSSEYFVFICQFSLHRLLHTRHLSSGAGTEARQRPTYQVDTVSPHPKKLKRKHWHRPEETVQELCRSPLSRNLSYIRDAVESRLYIPNCISGLRYFWKRILKTPFNLL